jgi:hypothetical protein
MGVQTADEQQQQYVLGRTPCGLCPPPRLVLVSLRGVECLPAGDLVNVLKKHRKIFPLLLVHHHITHVAVYELRKMPSLISTPVRAYCWSFTGYESNETSLFSIQNEEPIRLIELVVLQDRVDWTYQGKNWCSAWLALDHPRHSCLANKLEEHHPPVNQTATEARDARKPVLDR